MKKCVVFMLAAIMTMGLAACGNAAVSGESVESSTGTLKESQTQTVQPGEGALEESSEEGAGQASLESITITALNGNKEEAQMEVPYNPQRIAVLDMAALDILDNLGLGNRVVGSAGTSLDYLQSYVTDNNVENLGTIKEADLESVMACEPDIIFIGGRLSSSYDALSEIAPVVYLATDAELGLVESTKKNASIIASIFGLEDQVESKMADFAARIEALSAFAQGKTAMVGMCTSGSFNVLGDDGRCSIIGVEIGFENLGNTVKASDSKSGEKSQESQKGQGGQSGSSSTGSSTATHGNEASFEVVVEMAPEYIFVMDRDAAIGTDGAQLARQIMENELVMSTDAYKNGNIVYLAHPAVWYTAEGGITALDVMLSDLESELLMQ